MSVTVGEVATAALWAAVAALAVWLVTWPLRRRSLGALLASLVLTSAAASAGAMLGAVHAMLLPMGDEVVVLVLAGVAGSLAAVAGAVAAHRLAREHGMLRDAIAGLGDGVRPTSSGPRLSGELERLRDQLHATAIDLADSREREHALDRSRRELVAGMSHDLRTPLAGLRAMAEALEDGVCADPQAYYKQIGLSVERIDGMVNDLFALSRIQAGSLGGMSDPVSMGEVVTDVAAALEPLAAADEVAVSTRVVGAGVVRGNAAELGRAVTNVLANAVRHTPSGATVEVALAENDRRVVIEIADACGGIDPEHLPHLFEVGFRGSSARTPRADGGAGLGLAITRGIVEAHEGSVEVRNMADGCCFRIELPATGHR